MSYSIDYKGVVTKVLDFLNSLMYDTSKEGSPPAPSDVKPEDLIVPPAALEALKRFKEKEGKRDE